MSRAVEGTYRGICVDTADPMRLGRIRVQVPQVMGSGVSGWAFPAWTGDDTHVWPQDRLPRPGEGVWVLFEGPDRMTWTAVFGPVEESKQLLDLVAGNYEPSVTLSIPNLPPGIGVPVGGSLVSAAGTPGPGAAVRIEKSPDAAEGNWAGVDGEWPVRTSDGAWTGTLEAREGESQWWYRPVFDGLDPWSAAVGAPVRSLTEGRVAVLSWTPPSFPWLVPATVTGILRDLLGDPLAKKEVVLYLDPDEGPGVIAERSTTGKDGSWSIPWTRSEEWTGAFTASAVFLGDRTWQFTATDPVRIPAVSSPTSVSWTFPQTIPPTGTAFAVGGVLRATDPVHGVPRPNPSITVSSRSPSSATPPAGTWTPLATVPVAADGTWSVGIPNTAPSTDYRAEFPGTGVFTASSTPDRSVVTALATTVSTPAVPATIVFGQSISATGTVADQLSRPVESGTVEIDVMPSGGAWTRTGSSAVSATGTYSATFPVSVVGPVQWRARYLDNPSQGLLAGTSGSRSSSIGLSAPVITKGSISRTSASFTRSTVPGATGYQVAVIGILPWTTFTGTTYTRSLAANTNYTFKTRATATAPNGSTVVSGDSNSLSCYSGRDEVRRSGSFLWDGGATALANYRGSSWDSYSGGAYQGQFSSGNWYRGIIQFDNAAFRTFIHNNHYGADTWPHISWTKCEISLTRGSAANTGVTNVTPRFWVTDAKPYTGADIYGDVYLQGGLDSPQTVPVNGTAVCQVTEKHWAGHVLLEQFVGGRTIKNFAIARDAGSSYMQVTGARLGVGGSYNYQVSAAVAASWT